MYDATPIVIQSELSGYANTDGGWFVGGACNVCSDAAAFGSIVCTGNGASKEVQSLKFTNPYSGASAAQGKSYKSGQMPTSMSNMTKLTYLKLNADKFKTSSGTLPSDLSKASLLRTLTVTNVSLIGGIPKITINPTAPGGILLGSNSFSGTIPNMDLGANVNGLTLKENKKSLTFGSKFGEDAAAAVASIDMTNSKISGPLPVNLFSGAKPNLASVNFASNNLTGNIPTTWDAASTTAAATITLIDLSSNKLSGSVPWMDLTGLLSKTSEFNLCYNDISGTLNNALCELDDERVKYFGCYDSKQGSGTENICDACATDCA
jgi:hypothetical protein